MKTYALLALALLGAAGCSRQDSAAATSGNDTSRVAATPGSYPLKGEIIAVDVEKKILVVKHESIPGYMPAMTMEFGVSSADLAAAKVGQRIRADLIPSKDSGFRLEKIWPDDGATEAAIAASALALRQDTHSRGKGAYREIGETAPDFALYDQEGRLVQSARFRGKQVMLNFIYTRCPDVTMCPAATIKMTAAQRLAREAGVTNVEFVSITLDPNYDTPAILKEYAALRNIDTGNFSFLTGPEKAIKDLLAQFGLLAETENEFLRHTLATLLIDANGKIVHRADGRTWEASDFVARMKKP